MPPPMSKTSSRRVVPSGTSTRPVFLTAPTSEKTVVPRLRSVPLAAYQAAPRLRIGPVLAQVFTLLITVGLPHSPSTAGKGGRGRGSPLCPSIDAISAVSSPQTNAPAPRRTFTRSEKPLPKRSSPKSPRASACVMACRMVETASGYSLRT